MNQLNANEVDGDKEVLELSLEELLYIAGGAGNAFLKIEGVEG